MNVIQNYVQDFHGQKTTVHGVEGYKNNDITYFIIPKTNNEEIHYEQKAISDFLIENGVENIATPLINFQGQLTTTFNEQDYLVYAARITNNYRNMSHVERMADFHQIGANYPYSPNLVSSYGQWKSLWEYKIQSFENLYNQQYNERPVSRFQRLFIDTFPYLIGLSENALQYLQETETDWRYHQNDQASITFQRYKNQLYQGIIWSHELSYDHSVRDISEYIRPLLLKDDYQSLTKIKAFLTEYDSLRSLSIFSWRLLYARLLLPIHLFDFIEEGILRNNHENVYNEYKQLLVQQHNYEKNVKNLFHEVGLDTRSLNIPVLDW